MLNVLITGTTSGIGRALLDRYSSLKYKITAVNRRKFAQDEINYPEVNFEILDITDYDKVRSLLIGLEIQNEMPDIFILNAGINEIDNLNYFDFKKFFSVMQTNINGVMTFVGALDSLEIKGKKIICLSSTSNIIPNPAHLGYHLSKWCLHKSFQIFSNQTTENHFKSIVLGPVRTEIMKGYAGPEGIQKKIFDILSVSSQATAIKITQFIDSNKKVLNYPIKSIVFYWAVKTILLFFPSLYKGTQSKKRLREQTTHA